MYLKKRKILKQSHTYHMGRLGKYILLKKNLKYMFY